jgi:hypothetical protein
MAEPKLEIKYDPYEVSYNLRNIGRQIDENREEVAQNVQSVATIGKSGLDAYRGWRDHEMTTKIMSGDYGYSPEYEKAGSLRQMFMRPSKALMTKDDLKALNTKEIAFGGSKIPLPKDEISSVVGNKSSVLDIVSDKVSSIFGKSAAKEASKETAEVLATKKGTGMLGPTIGVGVSAYDMFSGKHKSKADRTKSALNFGADVLGLAVPPLGIVKKAWDIAKLFR